jgi:hypothetical protein
MHLDINAVIQARKESDENFKIYPVQYDDGQIYYVMEAGEFPRNEYVGRWYNEKFETHLEDEKSNVLLPTGRKCLGGIAKNGDPIWCDEYKYCGEGYVRTMLNRGNYNPEEQSSTIEGDAGSGLLSVFAKLLGKSADTDKWNQFPTNAREPQWVWIKKEPLRWIIRNWDDMPKQINPNGNGNAGYIDLRTEEGIVNLPFGSMHWQSSPIRAYCNGYTREQMQNNGNPQMFLSSTKIPDFTQQNFMSFVFGSDMSKVYRRDDVAAQKNNKHLVPNGRLKAFSGKLSKSGHWFRVGAEVLNRIIQRGAGLGKVETEENETADCSSEM